jgi:O-antigen/teichoic acid export membrane protein
VRRLLQRRFVQAGIVTYVFAGLTLITNLVTGVVMARALGPDGRGVAFALVTVSQLSGYLFAMGVAQSLSFFIARKPEEGPTLLTTWTLMLLPLAAIAVGITQLLLPTIFSTDGAEAISVGRWFLFTIIFVIGLELNYGLLLGVHDFNVYNVLRFANPALTAGAFVVLWAVDAMSVESALIASTISTGLVLWVGMARAVHLIGFGPPNARLGRTTLWYGVRGQGATVATHVNARLDIAMLPAFIAPAGVGLYSVATSVSLIVYQLSNTFAGLVLPAAAGDPERGKLKVVGSLYATLVVATAFAIVLALFAPFLLGLVYGEEFREAAEPLRLLLPGAVLFAGASILSAGVYAAGRPFTATLTQLVGVLVTVVGLLVFLRNGGITAAALVSTAAYGTVFVVTLFAYKRLSGMPWVWFLPTRERLRALAG